MLAGRRGRAVGEKRADGKGGCGVAVRSRAAGPCGARWEGAEIVVTVAVMRWGGITVRSTTIMDLRVA